MLLAFTATPLIARLVPTSLPIAEAPSVDLRVLAFAAAMTVAIAVAFGVAPAWRALRGTSTPPRCTRDRVASEDAASGCGAGW